MKIDLHVHASERSSCATAGEEEMIVAGREAGLDAICFTDHDRLVPRERLAELNGLYEPFRVFGGIEVSTHPGRSGDDSSQPLPVGWSLDHCLVIGVRDAELESRVWTYPELHAFVREREGFLAVCHPFRFDDSIPFGIDELPPDAIELRSVHTNPDDEEKIRETAKRAGARLVSNSDAHYPGQVGAFYNELADDPADEAALAALLRAGTYECRSRKGRGA